MKKYLTITLILLSMTACDNNDSVSSGLQSPDYSYEIDTFMENSEIYEFTPRSNKNKSCVIFILDNLKSASMQCFDKMVEFRKKENK